MRKLALTRVLVAGLLVGCADAAAPGLFGPSSQPEFAIVPSVDPNGQFSTSGNVILKGFNPTNPHRGDAIVATFFFPATSNIITSVGDHLTDGTPVGNNYQLVDFVTAGGIGMATYVAVNVQNFPDPNPDQNKVLVVQANLSTSIPRGGMTITAYSGVQPTFAQALGQASHGSGTSDAETMVSAGGVPVTANALVYGVTLANQATGVDHPPEFTTISTTGDGTNMTTNAMRLIASSAGTVEAQWLWGFGPTRAGTHPGTWLATAFSLNEAPTGSNQPPAAAFSSSCSALTCTFTNTSTDPDGSISSSSWNFGDGQTSTAANPQHTYAAAGTYNVTLTVTDNGGATNSVSHSVTVSAANQSPTAAFTSSCTNLTCTFTNGSSDPDGSIASNSWNFGDGQTSTAASPAHSYASAGTYTVTLTVTDNQGATGTVSHPVTINPANQTPTANFTFSCNGLTCGFTSTSSDPDGSISAYSWTFGDGGTSTLQNPSHSYAAGGSYTVTLRVTDNQGAQSPVTSKTVTVTAPNQTPTANFTFSCSALACSFTSTSSDPDGSISAYSWTFGDGGTSTLQNPSHSYAAGGTYTVTLRVTDNRGAQSPVTSKTVTVTAPNSPPVVNAGPDQVVLLSLLGVTYTLNASFSDANNNGPWSYTINWGDGNTSTGTKTGQGTISASHHYANIISTRTVTVTVRDASGASGSDSKVLTLIL